jgi:hypothetical protein
VEFIQRYRSTISPDITATGKYSFKAVLIQVANHKLESALPIQFVHWDRLSEEEKQRVLQFGAMVKFKEIPVSNLDTMRAGDVVKKVQAALGNPKVERGGKSVDRFNLSVHARCWRRYKARPPSGSSTPQETNPRFCVYDKRHDDYGYTQAWVDFLIDKLKDAAELDVVCRGDQPSAAASQLTSTAAPNAATTATPTPRTNGL